MSQFSKTEARPLSERIQKARAEGRTQQALELAKQLAKQEPTADNQQLLRTIIFERGCQLLNDGKIRDAIVVFNNARALEAPPEFHAAVAGKFAQLGDIVTALAMFEKLPDCPERAKAFEQAVDAALTKGVAGRALLPPDLHAAFDAVLAAFGHVEKGEDDAARDALQAISLSSPFLEWKVMLRGLIAFHQKDDARALDNWQRLQPERQPWRLVAPFRFQIDAPFREVQPPATRTRLQALVERLTSAGIVGSLRTLEKSLGASWRDDKVASEAFRQCRSFSGTFSQSNPALVRRIADVLYAKILVDGLPQDAGRFAANFPCPADDPRANRLKAIIAQRTDDDGDGLPEAIEGWLAYEQDIAKSPTAFPEPAGSLARALVWEQLGKLIGDARAGFVVPKHIPKSDDCYRKSIALAPGRVKPHQYLLDELKGDPKKRKLAIAAAKKLVAEFPDHATTWEYLGDALLEDKKPDDAIDAFRSALKGDPMRRDLRRKLADAVWAKGVKLATPAARVKSAPKPEKYRPILEEAIRYTEGNLSARYGAWVVLETRLGHVDVARDLLVKAESQPHQRVALPLALHAAALLDKKLPEEVRGEFAARWEATFDQKATPDEMMAALETLLHFDSKALRGKREIVESILPKLTNKPLEKLDEAHLLKIGHQLVALKMTPQARKIVDHARKRFPKNPSFLLLEYDIYTKGPGSGGQRYGNWKSRDLLVKARALALALPRETQERIIKEIESRESELGRLPDFDSLFGGFFDLPFDLDDDPEDDGW